MLVLCFTVLFHLVLLLLFSKEWCKTKKKTNRSSLFRLISSCHWTCSCDVSALISICFFSCFYHTVPKKKLSWKWRCLFSVELDLATTYSKVWTIKLHLIVIYSTFLTGQQVYHVKSTGQVINTYWLIN